MPAAKKAVAKKAVAKKPAARKPVAKTITFGPKRFELTIKAGELALVDPNGGVWSPAACGPHRSVAIIERAADVKNPAVAEGFQPGCEECKEQAQSTADYARGHASV